MDRSTVLALMLAASAIACRSGDARIADSTRPADSLASEQVSAVPPSAPAPATAPMPTDSAARGRAPNELGRIPVLEYHLVGDKEARWERQHERFRKDLEILYERGYRPVSVAELVDRKLDLPAGYSPIVFTFDDASPSHFRYLEKPDGSLEIDPKSVVGIWLDFAKSHPGWSNRAVFCVLTGAEAGRSLFGNKGIEGQKDAWRFQKVRFLVEQGFEVCNHTLWHAQLSKYPDDFVQEQIARGVMAIDSAVPGYRVRSFALPLGLWPKNRALAKSGRWTDPKTKRVVAYDFDAILEVSGGPNVSPHDSRFDPLSIDRTQIFGGELERVLDQLDRSGQRYVSDGDPRTVARPPVRAPATAPAQPPVAMKR